MKKTLLILILSLTPVLVVQAQDLDRAVELDQAIETFKGAEEGMHQEARDVFWDRVNELYGEEGEYEPVIEAPVIEEVIEEVPAPVETIPVVIETVDTPNIFEKAFNSLFSLFR